MNTKGSERAVTPTASPGACVNASVKPDAKWVLIRDGDALPSIREDRFGKEFGSLDQPLLSRAMTMVTAKDDEKKSSNPGAPLLSIGQTEGSAVEQLIRPSLVKTIMQKGKKGKVKKDGLVRVRLWQKINQSQGTTALVTASALQPSSGAGWSSIAALYDEFRCMGIDFYTKVVTGTSATVDAGVLAFDPLTSGNLGSVVEGLEHKHKVGPLSINDTTYQPSVTASGFHHWRAKLAPAFVSGASNDIIGGSWYSTGTSSAIVGYLKPYIENSSAGTVYQVTYLSYDMEFRYRG